MNPDEGGGIDWNSEVDRLLVMKMIIKMADISTPAKSYNLHRSWTKRITEEFYQQVGNNCRLLQQAKNTPSIMCSSHFSLIPIPPYVRGLEQEFKRVLIHERYHNIYS